MNATFQKETKDENTVNAFNFSNVELVRNTEWQAVELNGEEVDIPLGWQADTLGNQATFKKGKGLSKKDITNNGSNECVHYGELFTVYPAEIKSIKSKTNHQKNEMILSQKNDVLMPTSDVTPNGLATASCINKDGVILGGDILVITPNDNISGNYLSRYIRAEKQQVLQLATGSTVYHIYAKDMAQLRFKIPPLSQQTLIAQLLTTQEDHLESLRRRASLERKKLAFLSDELLSGRLRVSVDEGGPETVIKRDENGSVLETLPCVKLEANTEWQTVELNGEEVEIPLGWTKNKLDSLVSIINGFAFKTSQMLSQKKGPSCPIIKISNIQNNEIILLRDFQQKFFCGKINNIYYPLKNDLIVGLSGAGAGKSGVYNVNENAVLNQRNVIIRTRSNFLLQGYLNQFWFWDSILKLQEKTKSSAIPNISSSDILSLEIFTPDKTTQETIIQILSAQRKQMNDTEDLVAIEEKKLTWLTDELLSGRILVKERFNV